MSPLGLGAFRPLSPGAEVRGAGPAGRGARGLAGCPRPRLLLNTEHHRGDSYTPVISTAMRLTESQCSGRVIPISQRIRRRVSGYEAVRSHEASEEQSSRPASVCPQSHCLTPAAGRKRPGPAAEQNDQDGDQRVVGKDRGVLDGGERGQPRGWNPAPASARPAGRVLAPFPCL